MNTKLHAVTDAAGRPIRVFTTAGPYLGEAGSSFERTCTDCT